MARVSEADHSLVLDRSAGSCSVATFNLDLRVEGTAQQTVVGCFTEPGNTQTLDSKNLMIKLDPDNRINEGNFETDNKLHF